MTLTIDMITEVAVKSFARDATARNIEQQEAVFNGTEGTNNVLNSDQIKALGEGKPFVPDINTARDHAENSLRFGVGHRLKGAYSHYKAGNEMECIRHLILALDSVCWALGWEKASAYLNDQNYALFNAHRRDNDHGA